VLTATDIAVAAGRANIGDAGRVRDLKPLFVRRCQDVIDQRLATAADRSRISPDPVPVIAVGGGSILMPPSLGGLEVIRPEHFAVANAIGAAIAQTSGEVDRIYSLENCSRESALADAEQEARQKAVAAGATPQSIMVTEREDIPLSYLRGNATRVRVKVIGDMGL
jgi:N-methylhydantoinase A/oxoprolinase/acetone carboxylase beta subunit